MYRVEVEHYSDHELDGAWYELEYTESEEVAQRLVRYFQGWRRRKNGTEYMSDMGYNGRAVRYVECHNA